MGNKYSKITKILAKAELLTSEALSAEKTKRRDKKFAAAEKLGRKALALSREEISADSGVSGYNDFISSVYRLSTVLMRQGRSDEAEPMLSECCSMEFCDKHRLGVACNAYYGSVLCERGDYNSAGKLLSKMMKAAEEYVFTDDCYALCMGYGNAAAAFTYSDGAYSGSQFIEPVKKLLELREHGVDVGSGNVKKAAYFAASEALYRTCYDPVSNTEAGDAANLAQCCIDECTKSGDKDFYLPAAMRIAALATARDCQFGDCVKACNDTLDICSSYKYGEGESSFGSIQNIAADMNLLLGIMHYRVSHFEECIEYFKAAISALEADARGRRLNEVGYVEVERIIMRMTSAEKSEFAHRYLGLAMFALDDKYKAAECVSIVRKGAQLIEQNEQSEPYLGLLISWDYHIISQMLEKGGDAETARQFDEMGKSRAYLAFASLSVDSLHDKHMENLRARKRTALRLGLLELYGDYASVEIMLSQRPYAEEDHENLARLNFEIGEYYRIVGKHQLAVEHYDAVRKHTFDQEGNTYYNVDEHDFWEVSAVAKAACMVRLNEMPKARRAYSEFVEYQRGREGGELSKKQLVSIANVARDIGLNPAACAEYLHVAAVAFDDVEDENLYAAELFNQEGICWYNSSPETDVPDGMEIEMSDATERAAALTSKFSERELAAFENSYSRLMNCDPNNSGVVNLLPSLLSNIGECYVRVENYDKSLKYYLNSVSAFENMFAFKEFSEKPKSEQALYVMQYGVCFKALGEICDSMGDNNGSLDYFTKAIEVFERIDSDSARHELAYCLNARGCIRYRLGDYHGEVEDITRAIALKKDDKGSEITMAIMLKNRSDAYRELGNYRSMHSDLTKSIDMLDGSGMPQEILNSFYGSHWFSMGVCQEGLHMAGKAADSYRKAAKYIRSSDENSHDDSNTFMRAMCHFRRAVCLCRRDEQEFYGALFEYNNAIGLLENLPSSKEKNENLRQFLSSRGNLYEVFREIDLAKADYSRAEMLGSAAEEADA